MFGRLTERVKATAQPVVINEDNPIMPKICEVYRRLKGEIDSESWHDPRWEQEQGLAPELYGFYTCRVCGDSSLPSGVYVLHGNMSKDGLKPRVMEGVGIHELGHATFHSILPQRIRREYWSKKGKWRLEEPYADWIVRHSYGTGRFEVGNYAVQLGITDPIFEYFERPLAFPYCCYRAFELADSTPGHHPRSHQLMLSHVAQVTYRSRIDEEDLRTRDSLKSLSARPDKLIELFGLRRGVRLSYLGHPDPCEEYGFRVVKEVCK